MPSTTPSYAEGAGEVSMKRISSGTREQITAAMRTGAADGELSCAEAFEMARELGVDPLTMGRVADEIGVRFIRCQLGFYGYVPSKSIVKPAESVSPELEQLLLRRHDPGPRALCRCLGDRISPGDQQARRLRGRRKAGYSRRAMPARRLLAQRARSDEAREADLPRKGGTREVPMNQTDASTVQADRLLVNGRVYTMDSGLALGALDCPRGYAHPGGRR